MRSRVLAALTALPLLAFDCGGNDAAPPPTSPFGMICQLHIRGSAPGTNEDLWCIVSAFDYTSLGNPNAWGFELVAYRTLTQVGGSVGIFLPGRPALATAYAWTAATTTVESGSALRAIGDPTVVPSTYQETHLASAPMIGGDGTGSMSITFSAIPPVNATGQQLTEVHGTLSGTLEALDGASAPVTFSAIF